ncbi:MAG TPA: PAS domain S-box protein [Desulfosalsimonadaceae bacterium]|nr:PAS domain S-box protein [Desulfosalsimonadaceae bacterium]
MPASRTHQTPAAGFQRLRKEQLRYILDNLSDLLCLHDLEGTILAVNRTWRKESGIADPRWFAGKNIKQFIPYKYRQTVVEYLQRLSEEGASAGYVSLLASTRKTRVLEYNSLTITDSQDQPIAFACLGPDITERLKSEEALRKSEEKYRSILETIDDGYYEVDLKGRFSFCNPSLCNILGYSEAELLQMYYRQVCDPECHADIYQTFNMVYRTRRPSRAFDWKLTRKDGSSCYIEASVSLIESGDQTPLGFRGICRDVTERIEAEKERQNLETQLLLSQKSEALGTLAAGFAHNFNNILFPLIGYIDMTLMELPEDSRQRNNLNKALDAANRAKEIIRRVQQYTRTDKDQKVQPIDLPETVNQAIRLIKGSLSRRIALSVDTASGCPAVMADPDQIEQVVVNICTNAAEAIAAEGGSGSISVQVHPCQLTGKTPAKPENLPSGPYVCISVRDTGCGIDPAIAERIFDPFFTTKTETGKGLGLSLSQRIVKKYGGDILVDGKPGEGSMVHVYLPQNTASAPRDPDSPATAGHA